MAHNLNLNLNLVHKIIKGVPVFIDKDSNVYLFTQQVAEASPPILIGTTDGTSLTLYSDWKDRCTAYVEHYRKSLQTFQRTEHTKAVKYNGKKIGTTRRTGAAAAAATATATASAEVPASKSKTNRRTNSGQSRIKPGTSQNIICNP